MIYAFQVKSWGSDILAECVQTIAAYRARNKEQIRVYWFDIQIQEALI